MNQDSNNNQSTESSGLNQPISQEPLGGGQVAEQISPELKDIPDTTTLQPTSPLQIDNHETPGQGGGKKRLIKLIGVFVFVVLLLIVVTYIIYNLFIKGKYTTPSENQTTNNTQEQTEQTNIETVNSEEWLTYLNTVYGYTIDYPENWTTSVVADGGSTEATINSNSFDVYDPESADTYPVGVATLQVLDQEPFYDDSWEASEETINTVTMNKYVSVINDSMTSTTYLLDLGGEKYLEIVFRHEEGDGNKEIFERMINSFKMLSNEIPTETTTIIDDEESAYEGDFGEY